MTKLIIQIPCYNEEKHIKETVASLPRVLDGIDTIEVLVIDDGSCDKTVHNAAEAGVHYIKSLSTNRGLSNAFAQGIDACFRLGADIVVNTDADNQYCSEDIASLIKPILENRADIVIGDRQTDKIGHFSFLKKIAQKWGSGLVRKASGTRVSDSTSGFRALNRKAMASNFIHNRFTYTLESIVHAGSKGLTLVDVPVRTNNKARPSRLAKSSLDYIRRNGPVILRSYVMYWPIQTFGFLSFIFFLMGGGLVARFLYYYLQSPDVSSHIQSLQVGVGMVVIAFLILLLAILSDLISANRRIAEETLFKVRELEAKIERQEHSVSQANVSCPEGVVQTSHSAWLRK